MVYQKKILLLLGLLFLCACKQDAKIDKDLVKKSLSRVYMSIQGETMGTYYKISYYDSLNRAPKLKEEIELIFEQLNLELSNYIPESTISQFNNSTKKFQIPGNIKNNVGADKPHFRLNYGVAKDVYKKTKGHFDPTVMPLVDYWGFGTKGKAQPNDIDSSKIANLMTAVGMDKITYEMTEEGFAYLSKKPTSISLDFSALSKGYAVDEVANFLLKKRIKNFMVEIGGELVVKGVNSKSEPWTIGISKPDPDAKPTDFYKKLKLTNKAVASSGNYRNFHVIEGKQYGHTISPFIGFPSVAKVLSTTVVHKRCIHADAYCTAFMLMDPEKSIQLVELDKEMEALILYLAENGEVKELSSSGMEAFIFK